jgi:hypothetical protein
MLGGALLAQGRDPQLPVLEVSCVAGLELSVLEGVRVSPRSCLEQEPASPPVDAWCPLR